MKFITEIDLRDLYRKEPFTDYKAESGTRLTPGARQFLADKGINIFGKSSYTNRKTVKKNTEDEKLHPIEEHKSESINKQNDWRMKKLYSKMGSMEALFLITEEELLGRDVFLAQNVINLGKQFTNIKNAMKGKGSTGNLCCNGCTGINTDNFSSNVDDCFEITEFHVQLEKGREILILHRLRCALREIEPAVLETVEGDYKSELYKDVVGKINQVINSLSQMICSIIGGKKCQREI
ncbi:ethanolamine utilization protein [Clostridium sp. Mt-5]|uniref:Ethanolamine utilization protein n=1 Tax=Clostridium moutaii TaxID=3240932 RepID=A0ABV4BQ30_9CLOT